MVAMASTPFAFGVLVTLLYGTLIDKYIIERTSSLKFIQFINGVGFLPYWLPGIIIDYGIIMVSMFSCLFLLALFDEPGLSSSSEMPRLMVMLSSFTYALFPFMGLFSMVTSSHVIFQSLNLLLGSFLGRESMKSIQVLDIK